MIRYRVETFWSSDHLSTRDDQRYADSSLRVLREPYVGRGKLEVLPKVVARDLEDIALLYTPGVGYAVKEILAREGALGELTGRDNTIAVVTDGSAVLGLGRAGPRAALPVMEDYPNQCNNVLAFPGLMRGALDCGALRVDHDACLAAARAIAGDVPESELRPDNILPTPLSSTLYPAVSEAVAQDLVARNLARRHPPPGAVAAHTGELRTLVAERQAFVAARTPKYQTHGVHGRRR